MLPALLLQTLLLPTPCNIDPIHVPGEDLLALIKVQQHILTHLRLKLPLLNGMFVLVPTAQQAAPSNGSGSSTSSSLTATAIPWRLRQISAVEVAPGGEAADATVVLVGGDRVCAGAVREGLLAEVQDYQVSASLSSVLLIPTGHGCDAISAKGPPPTDHAKRLCRVEEVCRVVSASRPVNLTVSCTDSLQDSLPQQLQDGRAV
jgi:hypothetical protein